MEKQGRMKEKSKKQSVMEIGDKATSDEGKDMVVFIYKIVAPDAIINCSSISSNQ